MDINTELVQFGCRGLRVGIDEVSFVMVFGCGCCSVICRLAARRYGTSALEKNQGSSFWMHAPLDLAAAPLG
jgi:hypothetical protein